MIIAIRFIFILGCAGLGYVMRIPWLVDLQVPHSDWISAGCACLIGIFIVLIDVFFKQFTVRNILAVIIGLALGLLTHRLFMMVLTYVSMPADITRITGMATAFIFSVSSTMGSEMLR